MTHLPEKPSKTPTKNSIAVVGAIGIDTNIYFSTNAINFDVEANFTQNLDYIGQAGGYVSRGYAQLGYPTAFIGFVGNDWQGRWIRHILEHDHINITALDMDPQGTKRSINFMYPNGERKNFYDGKGHMELDPPYKASRDIFQHAQFAHFALMNWSRHLLPIAKAAHIPIAVDLQDIEHVSDPYRQEFIAQADILFFSTVNHPNPMQVIQYILQRNHTTNLLVIAGMGARGVAIATRSKVMFYDSVEISQHPIIDTNGAGDGLAVGFLSSYLIEGYSLEQSILRGQIVARYTCGIKASTDTLITQSQLNEIYSRMIANFHPRKEVFLR